MTRGLPSARKRGRRDPLETGRLNGATFNARTF